MGINDDLTIENPREQAAREWNEKQQKPPELAISEYVQQFYSIPAIDRNPPGPEFDIIGHGKERISADKIIQGDFQIKDLEEFTETIGGQEKEFYKFKINDTEFRISKDELDPEALKKACAR